MIEGRTTKICPHCHVEKSVLDFYKYGRCYSSWCKECTKELSRQRILDGRNKESRRKYREAHPKVHKIKSESPKINNNKTYKSKAKNQSIKCLKLSVIKDNIDKDRGRDPYRKMIREMYYNVKKRSLYRNKEIDIDIDYIEQLVREFCENNYHVITCRKHPFKPSIDRIDNSKGYTKDNIKITWLIENYCKNSFSEEDVLRFCEMKVAEHKKKLKQDKIQNYNQLQLFKDIV